MSTVASRDDDPRPWIVEVDWGGGSLQWYRFWDRNNALHTLSIFDGMSVAACLARRKG